MKLFNTVCSLNSKQTMKFFILITMIFLNINCYQIYTLQNASLLPKKETELMGTYSLVPYYDHLNKSNNIVANQIGIHFKYGVTSKYNATFNYVLNIPQYKYISNVHFISFGNKFSLIKDHLACYLPFGIYINNDFKSYNPFIVQPTLISSITINKYLKLNLALADIFFFEKIKNTPALTIGLDIDNLFNKLTFRTEFGCATNHMTNGIYYSFNIGIAYRPTKAAIN